MWRCGFGGPKALILLDLVTEKDTLQEAKRFLQELPEPPVPFRPGLLAPLAGQGRPAPP